MTDRDERYPFLSRRGFLISSGMALGAGTLFPAATPSCTLTNEQEEGPYYIDDETLRRDITEAKPGVPLLLAVRLVDGRSCAPLPNAAFDIWHCDATGVYSGFTSNSPDGGPGGRPPGGPPGPPPGFPEGGFNGRMPPGGRRGGPNGPRSRVTDTKRFLRGVQVSDDRGLVEFSSLYPGWYSGRAIHIHMKVHLGGVAQNKYSGGHVAHTGQFFFPEEITERVAKLEPYAKRLAVHRTTEAEDGIFNSQHGAECMLKLERLGRTDQQGFRATATLAIDPEATPAPVGGFGGGRGPASSPPRG